jgi:hypothetical protein
MNFPTIALGIEQFPLDFPFLDHNYYADKKAFSTDYYFLIQPLVSVKVQNEENGYPVKVCPIYGIHSRIARPISVFYALNSGVEILFDGYVRETIKRAGSDLDYKRFSLTLGQDFMFGKVIFTQYFGVYLYSPYKARNPIYQKYELAYRLNNKVTAAVFLKAHMHVGDLLGFCANITLFSKERENK